MANYDTIRTEVLASIGNRADVDARIGSWINDAYFELLLSPRFSFFELDNTDAFTTVASQRTYTLVNGLWHILSVRDDTNERKIRRSHWSYLDKIPRTEGQPMRYTRFSDTIEFHPTPDAAYNMTVRYRVRPTELATGVDLLIGREWVEAITLLAISKAFQRLENPEEAAKHRQLAEVVLSRMLDVSQLEDMDSEITIGVRTQ